MTTTNFTKELQETIAELALDIERLTVENNLLRKASESQRQLNGRLRKELHDLEYHCDVKTFQNKEREDELTKQLEMRRDLLGSYKEDKKWI